MNHVEELKYRISITYAIKKAKSEGYVTYTKIAKDTNLSKTVISRYSKGHVIPNLERAKDIEKVLINLNHPDIFCEHSIKARILVIETLINELKNMIGIEETE